MLQNQANVQLIDVRTPGEYAGGSLKGAQNMDIRSADFNEQIEKLDKKQPVFVYCLSGGRSASAARKMTGMGLTDVIDLQGGIMAWKREGLVVERNSDTRSSGLGKAEYDQLVEAKVPVLVNIYAPWCGPCRKMKPMLDELSQSASGKFKYVKLNADENDPLLKELGVAEIPTFFIYKNGKQVWKYTGLVERGVLEQELGL